MYEYVSGCYIDLWKYFICSLTWDMFRWYKCYDIKQSFDWFIKTEDNFITYYNRYRSTKFLMLSLS